MSDQLGAKFWRVHGYNLFKELLRETYQAGK